MTKTDDALVSVRCGDRARIVPIEGGYDAYSQFSNEDEEFGPDGLILMAFRAIAPNLGPAVGDRVLFETYMQMIENKTLLMHLFFEEDHIGVHVCFPVDTYVDGVKADDVYVRVIDFVTTH